MEFIPVCEPFLNGNEAKYVNDCVETGWISSAGKYVKAFESEFAKYCNAEYAVGVCNGTVAIHLALTAVGIGKGDEVIIPNFTMIATAFAVCYTGAMPVFVDANRETWNIDVSKIEKKITSKTKAIIPVSIFGLPCDMDAIMSIAKKYNLIVIEDAAESHGAEYKEKRVGSIADITTFSFFANKNLTTGEGGAVVTNNEEYYKKLLYFKNMCFPIDSPRNYMHDDIGFNYRMSNIHAAIGLAQIEKANMYRDLRIKNNNLYRKYLKDVKGIVFQKIDDNYLNVCWMNGIVIDEDLFGVKRDDLVAFLKENNVDTRLFFKGMNIQPSLIKYGCAVADEYEVSKMLSNSGFYLPSGSNLTENQIKYICDLIASISK